MSIILKIKVIMIVIIMILKIIIVTDNIKNNNSSSRSSRPEALCKKSVLKNLAKFIGKHLCQSLFFNKVAG